MQKYVIIFTLLSLLFVNEGIAQMFGFLEKYLPYRYENRKTNDLIYESGDTLYLFYDPLDSLQHLDSHMKALEWKLHELSPIANKTDPWGEYGQVARVFPLSRKCDNLTLKDLEGIVLTSRQELCDFYRREYKRKGGIDFLRFREEKMTFYFWDLGNYFARIYVFVVQEDGKITKYRTLLWGSTDEDLKI